MWLYDVTRKSALLPYGSWLFRKKYPLFRIMDLLKRKSPLLGLLVIQYCYWARSKLSWEWPTFYYADWESLSPQVVSEWNSVPLCIKWLRPFLWYCKFGNFRVNFIFANSVKRHICDVKIANRVWFTYISNRQSDIANSRGFDFHETSHMRSFAKIKHSRKFPNLQYFVWSFPIDYDRKNEY